ncbi:MAG: 50S ribosomal protein L9 [Candidatus Pacebacteria bacterium]|jgi:large subunit ribosomal protein L9|nr:50S ribosomal protein L9 [Candidatus Paceibacterota bacterium]
MKIYLLKEVSHLGKQGEIKEVSDGYALNYLLPNKIARRADAKIIEKVSQQKEQKTIEEKNRKEEALKLADGLQAMTLEISLKFSKKGKEAYDSVNSKRIIEELKNKDINLKESQIELKTPIKKEGDYEIPVILDKEVKTSLKIKVKAAE